VAGELHVSAPATIGSAVEAYLDERRRLGFQMHGSELRRFARYADKLGHKGPITSELQISWAKLHVRTTTPGTGRRRLEILSPFVRHYCQYEQGSVVLDPSILGPSRSRPTPHIYTEQELADLISAAGAMEGGDDLRAPVHATLFGLLAATGLRLSESLKLTNADIDLQSGLLTVRMTKFRKSRRLPLHRSTIDALVVWSELRNQHWPYQADGPFFVGHSGTELKARSVEWNFERLRDSLGWKSRGTLPQPRIHDLRHSFAVRRVKLWHEREVPVEQAMFWLCTYLGHAKISDTYWYLTGVPELMAVAGYRFEQFARDVHTADLS